MTHLFSPLSIRNLQLENRIVVSPMCQYSGVHGVPQFWHSQHYGSFAASGPGLVAIEATGVTPEGLITPYCLGLWTDEQEAAFKQLVAEMKSVGDSKVSIQLNHAGRKGSTEKPWVGGASIPLEQGGWVIVAPSAIAYDDRSQVPQELDLEGIERIKQAFVDSARRAERAGFDCIELQFAHGYLVHEFLSPISNKRTDHYGGSLENRMRFPLEIISAIRAALAEDKPLGVRISGTEWTDEASFNIDEAKLFSAEAKKAGVDFICLSSGGNLAQVKIPLEPCFQVSLAAAVKETSGALVRAVGLIITPEQAEEVVAEGKADMVAIGRGFLYDPRWAWHAAKVLGVSMKYPIQFTAVQPNFWRALKFDQPPKI